MSTQGQPFTDDPVFQKIILTHTIDKILDLRLFNDGRRLFLCQFISHVAPRRSVFVSEDTMRLIMPDMVRAFEMQNHKQTTTKTGVVCVFPMVASHQKHVPGDTATETSPGGISCILRSISGRLLREIYQSYTAINNYTAVDTAYSSPTPTDESTASNAPTEYLASPTTSPRPTMSTQMSAPTDESTASPTEYQVLPTTSLCPTTAIQIAYPMPTQMSAPTEYQVLPTASLCPTTAIQIAYPMFTQMSVPTTFCHATTAQVVISTHSHPMVTSTGIEGLDIDAIVDSWSPMSQDELGSFLQCSSDSSQVS